MTTQTKHVGHERTVSVVLPTFNRLPRLRRVLAGLERQSYPLDALEVIVVSDGSTDGTHDYLRSLATSLRLRLAVQENSGPAAARNLGVAQASGDIVLFIDDDVVPEPTLLAEHLRAHRQHGDNVVVLGPMLTPADFVMLPWVRWEQAMLAKQYTAMQAGRWEPSARQFYTGNCSLLRRHLLAVGGFDSTFRRAEDVELGYRLAAHGLRFVFNPRAIGYHYAERSFLSWLEIPYAYGRNDVVFARDKQQRWLLPTAQREFRERNPLVRLLVRVCLGRPGLGQRAQGALSCTAALSGDAQLAQLQQMAFSALFNLRYYEGMADELGGRERFMQLIAGSGGEDPCAVQAGDRVAHTE
jgi:GT2 family glycosyltransferase